MILCSLNCKKKQKKKTESNIPKIVKKNEE